MSRKEYVADALGIIKAYDRYLLSDSIFSDPNAYQIATYLAQSLPQGRAYVNQKSRVAVEKPGNQNGRNAFILLRDKGIIKGELNISFEEATKKAVSTALTNGKSLKVLLITQDENEGYEYERMDYEDNHLNDIDAIGFDASVKCIKYVYETTQKEEFAFKFVFPGSGVSSLQIVFHKTTGLEKKIISDPNNPNGAVTFRGESKGFYLFTYKTFKDVLFEADKFQLVGQINGQTFKSDLNDFFIGQEQRWIVNISNQKLICTFYIGSGNTVPKDQLKPEPQPSPKEDGLEEAGISYTGHLYSRDPVPENEKMTDAFFGRTVDPTIKNSDQLINIAAIPKEGDVVYYSNRKTLTIGKQLGNGGEGAVYATNEKGVVVKIYHKPKLTKLRQKKIEKMTGLHLGEKNPNIIWPLNSVYTSNNIFVGFTMKSIGGGMSVYSFLSQTPTRKRADIGVLDVNRTQLVELVISLVDSIAYLHDRNILIRDLKDKNLMLFPNDPTRCLLVDCDSFQVGEYVAPVHTPEYIPPEAFGVNAGEVYQNKYSDVFTLFVNIFKMLVTKNGNIYVTKGVDKTNMDLCREGAFPFSMTKSITDTKVCDSSAIPWSHVPSYLKDAFISVADKNGKRYEKTKRLMADEWLKLLLAYHKDLKAGPKGRLGSKDPNYNVTYYPLQAIDYHLVDLKLVSVSKGEMTDFSIRRIVKRILKRSQLTIDENEIVDSLKKTGAYKKDGKLVIAITRDVGIICTAKYAYNEI